MAEVGNRTCMPVTALWSLARGLTRRREPGIPPAAGAFLCGLRGHELESQTGESGFEVRPKVYSEMLSKPRFY